MKYIIDIDGTICSSTNSQYEKAEPYVTRIKHFNELYDLGMEVHYWTARGGNSGKDWSEFTTQQLEQWGVKYTSLSFKKPSYDLWIDDKSVNVNAYFNMTRGDSPQLPESF
jgi:hypothetical protein